MLFYCAWDDESSFVCDVESKGKAIAAATEHVGRAPVEVRPIPVGVFACDVDFPEAEEDEDDFVTLTPLEHVELALEALEDACTPPDEDVIMCMSECDDERGNPVRCELRAHGDATEHVNREAGLTW